MGVSKRLYMGVSTHTYDDVLTHLHMCVLQRRPLIVAERQHIAHGQPGDMPWPYTWRVETIIGRRFRTTRPFQNKGIQVCGNINIWECGNTHMK